MKTFRIAFLERFGQSVLSAPVNLCDDATNLLPRDPGQRPLGKAFTHTFQFGNRLLLPAGKRGGKTFPFHRQQFFDPWELLICVVAQLNQRLVSYMGITQIRNEASDLTQAAILTRPPIFSHLVLCQAQRGTQFFKVLANLMHSHTALSCRMPAQSHSGLNLFSEDSIQTLRQRLAQFQAIAHVAAYSVASRTLL